MEILIELELDVVRSNDWGWQFYQIVVTFQGFFQHRGHRMLPLVSFFV